MSKKTNIIAASAFAAGLGVGAGSSVLTAPAEVIYMDAGTRIQLDAGQALPIVREFVVAGAWTGNENETNTCVLESKRLNADGSERAFDAWCSGKKRR